MSRSNLCEFSETNAQFFSRASVKTRKKIVKSKAITNFEEIVCLFDLENMFFSFEVRVDKLNCTVSRISSLQYRFFFTDFGHR